MYGWLIAAAAAPLYALSFVAAHAKETDFGRHSFNPIFSIERPLQPEKRSMPTPPDHPRTDLDELIKNTIEWCGKDADCIARVRLLIALRESQHAICGVVTNAFLAFEADLIHLNVNESTLTQGTHAGREDLKGFAQSVCGDHLRKIDHEVWKALQQINPRP